MEPHERYLNRELSWLDFNKRVLALAENEDVPLLERTKFVAIFNDNLDEFFQVRVAGLMEQVAAGVRSGPPDGMGPRETLEAIRERVIELYERQSVLKRSDLFPRLEEIGIRVVLWGSLDETDRAVLYQIFKDHLFPVLTPLAVDPAHPFPYISNLSLNLAVLVRDPETDASRFARVKVPDILPRFVALPDGERFVPLEQVIGANLSELFPGMEIVERHPFRVTRNADLEVEEDLADDLLEAIESELVRRRFGRVVRLEVERNISPGILDLLKRELKIDDAQVYPIKGLLGLGGLWALESVDRPDHRYEPFTPTIPPRLSEPDQSIFDVLKRGDVLVHHPYDSFMASTAEFIRQAARDPNVLAIKQTLYRISADSPIARSLMEAADEGKQVVVLVELKARFDEERNIEWARSLEEAGVHVVYGMVGLKTHTKVTLVIRNEEDVLVRYSHIGTGNYNDRTARLYEDIGILTADLELGADLGDLFNVLTGYSRQKSYRKLVVAPVELRPRIMELIRREAGFDDGHIVMKMNSLVDSDVIDALYEASQAGTRIDLIVRGICCLRPGVPGMSDNITVRSLLGRYLEHSRIYRFGRPSRGFEYLIGSADMMPRNLDRRIEAVTPVDDVLLQERLEEILDLNRADDHLAWKLAADGTWSRRSLKNDVDAQLALQDRARRRAHPDG
jgi:polyphosphate kinase